MTRPVTAVACALLTCAACPLSVGDDGTGGDAEALIRRVRENRRLLWRSAVAPLGAAADARGELHDAVRRLRALKLPEGLQPPPPTTQPTTAPTAGPRPEAIPARRLPPEVLAQLRSAPPKGATRPLALADALFGSGHLAEALVFYGEALSRKPGDDDRAWILFQMANCHRQDDPAAAAKLYKQLTAEHPSSPWAGAGRIQGQILNWQQTEKPEDLLDTLAGEADRRTE